MGGCKWFCNPVVSGQPLVSIRLVTQYLLSVAVYLYFLSWCPDHFKAHSEMSKSLLGRTYAGTVVKVIGIVFYTIKMAMPT